ncbi:hypothetical protein VT85_26375 (plasmid) [Planctomyces sp. SH-PL62]|nr:hypothetical protein VT85_26375 [Planctomyces sp. SH-PL62]
MAVEDVRTVAPQVLRHRIVVNYNAQADGQTSDTIVKRLLDEIPVRKGAPDAAASAIFRS